MSQYIGIAQGTIYVYFQSKEDLFQEIFSIVNNHQDINDMKCLTYLPISAKQKILQLSHSLMQRLEQDESYAAKITLNTQMMFEKNDFRSRDTTYQSELYKYVAKIIKQGQKEKTVVTGSAMKLADYYWGLSTFTH
ncbi:MAG: helix-turn-helix domain-containing protein [Coprobacillus cateniformis]